MVGASLMGVYLWIFSSHLIPPQPLLNFNLLIREDGPCGNARTIRDFGFKPGISVFGRNAIFGA